MVKIIGLLLFCIDAIRKAVGGKLVKQYDFLDHLGGLCLDGPVKSLVFVPERPKSW